eukprot:m.166218 g.166218  ORF g.166218 m.166218 type:complete len:323 (+) comp21099_c3_seq1:724-1692(+)
MPHPLGVGGELHGSFGRYGRGDAAGRAGPMAVHDGRGQHPLVQRGGHVVRRIGQQPAAHMQHSVAPEEPALREVERVLVPANKLHDANATASGARLRRVPGCSQATHPSRVLHVVNVTAAVEGARLMLRGAGDFVPVPHRIDIFVLLPSAVHHCHAVGQVSALEIFSVDAFAVDGTVGEHSYTDAESLFLLHNIVRLIKVSKMGSGDTLPNELVVKERKSVVPSQREQRGKNHTQWRVKGRSKLRKRKWERRKRGKIVVVAFIHTKAVAGIEVCHQAAGRSKVKVWASGCHLLALHDEVDKELPLRTAHGVLGSLGVNVLGQ